MIKQLTSFLILATTATAVEASIAFNFTESGSTQPTVGSAQAQSWDLSLSLYEANNSMTNYSITTGAGTGYTTPILGMGMNDFLNIGYLQYGSGQNIITYDRLALVPVLQVIGSIGYSSILSGEPFPSGNNGPISPRVYSSGGMMGNSPARQAPQFAEILPPAPPGPTPIPEPHSAFILLLAGASLLLHKPSRH